MAAVAAGEMEEAGAGSADDPHRLIGLAGAGLLAEEQQGTCEGRAGGRRGDPLEAAVAVQSDDLAGDAGHRAAGGVEGGGGVAVEAVGEDAMMPLETDQKLAAGRGRAQRQALGVALPLVAEEVSVGIAQGRGADVLHRHGVAGVVGLQPEGDPVPLVGDRDQLASVIAADQRRERLEGGVAGGEDEAAEELEVAEAAAAGLGGVEGGDRPDAHRRGAAGRRGRTGEGVGGERDGEKQCDEGPEGAAEGAASPAHALIRRRGPRRLPWVSPPGRSSNSEASWSVMAPASSSASTMVTARR